jgi:hypothetical protein
MRCMNSAVAGAGKPLHALHQTLTSSGISEWRIGAQGSYC